MHVLLAHSNSAGSNHYRIQEPVRAVREAGYDVHLTVSYGLATTMASPPGGGPAEVVDVDAQGADVVVLQLPKTVEMLQCLRLLQARGVAVVVEIDDSFRDLPYGHPAYDTVVRGGITELIQQCAREADLVTTTTPALLDDYARHGRGAVVTNAVPRRVAELPPAYEREPEVVTVGWTGSAPKHPYDLEQIGTGLQQALQRSAGKSRFVVMGQKYDAQVKLGLVEDPVEIAWNFDIDGYTAAIGETIDVGLAPLRIDRFNTCKSWLKVLEYAARGVYAVRSHTAEYDRLGLGMRAKAPRDWAKWISVGIEDADRRREQAAAAREVVLARHLTEHTAEQWAHAWRRAADHRTRARRAAPRVPAGATA